MAIKVKRTPRPERPPLWKRLVLGELIEGLMVTLVHNFRALREPFTIQYPDERLPLEPRYRGVPRLRSHPETGEELCISCHQCERICPDECIHIEDEPHPSGRGKRPRVFTIDYERCCLCGLCVEACPTKPITSIYMSHDYELARYRRDEFKADLRELYFGKDKVVYGRRS